MTFKTTRKTLIKTISTTLVLAAFGAVNATATEPSAASAIAAEGWVLAETVSANEPLFFSNEANFAFDESVIPTKSRPDTISEIDPEAYSKFNVQNFEYPLLGSINLAVGKEYSKVLMPHNTLQTNRIVYQAPDSIPYDLTPYRVTTTATAQVKFPF